MRVACSDYFAGITHLEITRAFVNVESRNMIKEQGEAKLDFDYRSEDCPLKHSRFTTPRPRDAASKEQPNSRDGR